MRDAFAKKIEKLQSCELQTVSFFELIETIWEGPNDQPFHRFCTLMRKMNALSYVHEEFLSNCCAHKAGIAPDAWKDPETEVYLFTAEVFGAEFKEI